MSFSGRSRRWRRDGKGCSGTLFIRSEMGRFPEQEHPIRIPDRTLGQSRTLLLQFRHFRLESGERRPPEAAAGDAVVVEGVEGLAAAVELVVQVGRRGA